MRTLANNTILVSPLCRLIVGAAVIAATIGQAGADDPVDGPAEAARKVQILRILEAQARLAEAQRLRDARQIEVEAEVQNGLNAADHGRVEYDDDVVDDVDGSRVRAVPAKTNGVAAEYFEQMIFGSRGQSAVAAHQDRLSQLLQTRAGTLNLACELSHDQMRKLELAGQGDIKRLFERIDQCRQQYLPVRDEDAPAAMRSIMQENATLQPLLRFPFGKGSLFSKTARHTLTDEQWSDFELATDVERLRGKIEVRTAGSKTITVLRLNASVFAELRLATPRWWGSLRGLSLESTPVTDADAARLESMAKLELLDLGATHVTDAGLAHVKHLRKLQALDLRRTRVTDAGLAQLSQLTALTNLHLGCSSVSGAGLVHLRSLTNLESLILFQTAVADDDLRHLAALGKLQELGLDGTQVTDAGLVHLAGLKSLHTLSLSSTKLTDAGLAHLRQLPQLKRLTVLGTNVSAAAAADLERSSPGMKVIR